jgi:hypothetical protein
MTVAAERRLFLPKVIAMFFSGHSAWGSEQWRFQKFYIMVSLDILLWVWWAPGKASFSKSGFTLLDSVLVSSILRVGLADFEL